MIRSTLEVECLAQFCGVTEEFDCEDLFDREDVGEGVARARARGWLVSDDGEYAYCPRHHAEAIEDGAAMCRPGPPSDE